MSTFTIETARAALSVAIRESAAALEAMIAAQSSPASVERVRRADAAMMRAQNTVAAMTPRVRVTHACQVMPLHGFSRRS